MKIPAGLSPIAQAVIGEGNRLRRERTTTVGSRVTDKSLYVQVYGEIDDPLTPYTLPKVGGGTITSTRWAFVGVYGEMWQCASLLLTNRELTATGKALFPQPVADCSALENRLAGIATAARGVVQAAQAIEGLAT